MGIPIQREHPPAIKIKPNLLRSGAPIAHQHGTSQRPGPFERKLVQTSTSRTSNGFTLLAPPAPSRPMPPAASLPPSPTATVIASSATRARRRRACNGSLARGVREKKQKTTTTPGGYPGWGFGIPLPESKREHQSHVGILGAQMPILTHKNASQSSPFSLDGFEGKQNDAICRGPKSSKR